MSVAYKKQSLLPMIGLAAACLVAGILGSASWFAFTSQARGATIARQVSTSLARVQLLESILRRQAEVSVSLANSEVPAADPAAARPPPAAVAPAVAAVRKERIDRALAVAGQQPINAAATAKPVSAPPVAVTATGGDPPASGSRQKPIPGSAVTSEALNLARASNKIEGLDSTQLGTKLGVEKLESSGVVMRSGKKVPIGGRFPSGERLLSVDPVDNQIITDQRTIMVF